MMKYLYLFALLLLITPTADSSACSLTFISPEKGSTVTNRNITVYGTGKANPEAGDYGTVTATLNGVIFFNVSGSFSYAMSIFETRGVPVTLRPGANYFVVQGSAGSCSASDSMTIYYLLDKDQNLGPCGQ